jgi:predicted signal transduction protein with EAL and GGDEF domain
LKLDRALVRVRPGDRGGDLVLQTIRELAERLGLATVGEGLEEAADLERLRAMGCTHAQGFHIARPMPVAELARWLAGRTASADPALPGAARREPAVAGCDGGRPAATVRGRAAGPPTVLVGCR